MFFELNYNNYLHVFSEENTDLYLHLIIADKLVAKLQKLLAVYRKNLYYI